MTQAPRKVQVINGAASGATSRAHQRSRDGRHGDAGVAGGGGGGGRASDDAISQVLRQNYDDVIAEAVPERLLALLDELRRKESE
ncbi:MAG: NepR family anti-sigma factor [Pseudomonadota bacterium]